MKAPLLRLRFALIFCLLPAIAPALQADPTADWSVAMLDQILANVQPGQKTATVGDMNIRVSNLSAWRNQLAGGASLDSAFDGTVPKWTGGNVYYTFSTNVPANNQKAFLDAAGEWATFANLHFILRSNQTNYVTVQVQSGLEGGQADVGMIGGQQFLSVSPDAWNRGTLCHEIGHTLGLVHEHQRSDRDSFVTILTNNITNGGLGNFVLLGNSQNQGAYDFLSVMHYARNYLSVATNLDTIEPLPAYTNFINLMGQPGPVILSLGDGTGMAAAYGTVPTNSPVVTNTLDSGRGSLRAALYYAFDHPGTHITFNIPTNDPGYSHGVFTITPSDQLPWIVNSTFLDAASQPTNATSNPSGPLIQLEGSVAATLAPGANGLFFGNTNCIARGFVINRFPSSGVLFTGTNITGNVLAGCYLSTDPTGTISVSNVNPGVTISGGARGNLVGGSNAAARNLLSGSGNQGLAIRDPGTINNVVAGNYIGLNGAGTGSLSNTFAGIEIFNGATGNIIGGISPGMGNVISGNGLQGILISDAGTTGNIVEGNYVGLNPAGTGAIPNGGAGIFIGGTAQSNLIGGTAVGAGNVVSGNTLQGVVISAIGANANIVEGNLIGLNATGTAALSNGWAGVEINFGAASNVIGGTLSGAGNVISGNGIQGIALRDAGTSGNWVGGNYIGLDSSGTVAVPNNASGIESFFSAGPNQIGAPGGRNYICGNLNYGVLIDSASVSNVIQGNSVGVTPFNTGSANLFSGIGIFGGATSTIVGGTNVGAANDLAFNIGDGVILFDSITLFNSIRGNSIHGNTSAGIDTFSSANGSPNVPAVANAVTTTNTLIKGNLTTTNAGVFLLDLYANPSGSSPVEGQYYLGATTLTASGAGTFAFSFTNASSLPLGWIITATTTDASGNSSGFSITNATVTGTDSVGDGIPDAWRAEYFGGSGTTTNSTNCATCDPDHDGMNNRQEFLAGTNPTNSASALRLGALADNGVDINVNFQSVAGVIYRVEYKDSLTATNWSLLVDQIRGTGSVIQIPDPGVALLPRRFYRLDVLP